MSGTQDLPHHQVQVFPSAQESSQGRFVTAGVYFWGLCLTCPLSPEGWENNRTPKSAEPIQSPKHGHLLVLQIIATNKGEVVAVSELWRRGSEISMLTLLAH